MISTDDFCPIDVELEEHMALAILLNSDCRGACRGKGGVVSLFFHMDPPTGAVTKDHVRPEAIEAVKKKYNLG